MRTQDEIVNDIITAMHDSSATVGDVLHYCKELEEARDSQIKCKDCKHYAEVTYTRIAGANIQTGRHYCYKHGYSVTDGYRYCGDAERRADNGGIEK